MRVLPDCCLIDNESFSCGNSYSITSPWNWQMTILCRYKAYSVLSIHLAYSFFISSAHPGLPRKTPSTCTKLFVPQLITAILRSRVFTSFVGF